ncbi:MAG: hypothetical protein IJC41_00100 [Firmicutes bacterium]|nr:hypothetical protein [Clostridiales bacterium]MBQ4339387.1 hypothetical protein [Bacillota bacterium]
MSKNAGQKLAVYLEHKGWNINIISGCSSLDTDIVSHPDIYMCKLGPDDEAPVFFGDPYTLSPEYPRDVKYNAACTGKYFIHNLKFTDEKLLEYVRSKGLELINIKQGYSKCSIAVIDEDSVITSDEGAAKVLLSKGLDVLLIQKGHIKLPGYKYGFIGGTCGRIEDELIFNGDLSAHPDHDAICDFITGKGLKVKYFKDFELEDIGSVICDIQSCQNPYMDTLR